MITADATGAAVATDADFVRDQNTRTEGAFMGPRFAADVARIRALIEDPDKVLSVTRRGRWLYTFKRTGDNPRGLWLRRPADGPVPPGAAWDTVFDVDAFCAETGGDWHWRGAETAQFDPSRVLLVLSDGGSDRRRMLEFDCDAGRPVSGGFDLGPGRGYAVWFDRDTLIWSSAEDGDATRAGWPGTVRRLTRGGTDTEIFRADPDDLRCGGYVHDTADGPLVGVSRYFAIGKEETSLFFPDGTITLPTPPDTETRNTATHFAYVVRESGGVPGALMLGAVGGQVREVWRPGPSQAVREDSIHVLQDWLLWIVDDTLSPRLFALSLNRADAVPQDIAPPVSAEVLQVAAFDAAPGRALGSADAPLVLQATGFLQPAASWTFDLDAGVDGVTFAPLLEQPAQFDAAGLNVTLRFATSDDGTQVPYHLVRPATPGPVPTLMYGYGGFGISLSPYYSPIIGGMWLERGGAYALAHIRGGAELGPNWHLAAKGAGRERAFADFAAIARDLAQAGLATPAQIGCYGGSNGGLLTGVMLNRYPDRFGAIWSDVGVYDMLGFHDFPAGRGWIDEYGDPDDPEARAWLKAYSPLHNVPDGDTVLPPALITTSDNDDRVDPSHARRYAAALQAAGHAPWFYQHAGGHGGGGSSEAIAREQALGYGFLAAHLGVA